MAGLTNEELGRKLQFIRELKNISRIELAELLNQELKKDILRHKPLNERIVYNYESGLKVFTATFLNICCKALNINSEYFYADITKIIDNKSNAHFFDPKSLIMMRLKFKTLLDILERFNNKEIAEKFVKLLDNLAEKK